MSDPMKKGDRAERGGRIDDDDRFADEPQEVAGGSEAKHARVYEHPQGGGRSAITWILIALVVIALLLWLVF